MGYASGVGAIDVDDLVVSRFDGSMRPLWVGLVGLLGACVGEQETQIENARRSDEQATHEYAVSSIVKPACGSAHVAPGQPTLPGMQDAMAGSAHVRQPCGMVVAEISEPQAMAKFARVVCANLQPDACGQRFIQMFVARLNQRYPYANWSWVEQECSAYPVECAQWLNVETWALESHNATVVQWAQQTYRDRNSRANQQLDEVRRESNRKVAEFLQSASAVMARPAVSCTSTTYGGVTNTTCQ